MSIKMNEVFKLPMICEKGDGYIYSNNLMTTVLFDDTDLDMQQQKEAVSHAINNHDRLVEENKKLRYLYEVVKNYKMIHDLKGGGHIETGRAWDRMSRAMSRVSGDNNE